jgi:DNA mismatch endonuclease (patch repair protein)
MHYYLYEMADVHNKQTRSFNMSQIKGKNTQPEILVRKFLFANGFRYRTYDKKLPGKPDIVLPKYRTIIFIHGCFWHGHTECKDFVIPKTNTEWWLNKINRTKQNDSKVCDSLKENGWLVITLWECQLNGSKKINVLNNLYRTLNNIK